jgi:hypothetical protein
MGWIHGRGRRAASRGATVAVAAACWLGADVASARADRVADAEIFASSTTAIITDPGDPRLADRLLGFKREVKRIIHRGGGVARRSRLLDGMFFSPILGFATFQRSREFDVGRVSRPELHDIAATIARRFHQQSVLTFDTAERRSDPVDAVEVEVRGIEAPRLRFAFVADPEVRGRLMGASVTLGGRLMLVAALQDLAVVERFVTAFGASFGDATVRRGHREFVAAA